MSSTKPPTVRVKTYDLFLDLDFNGLTFKGRALIEIESERDVNLSSLGLNILKVTSNGKPFRFEQKDEDLVIGTGPFSGTLEVEYEGSIPDVLVGIYRAPYGNTHIITTQFEAAHARRMFPCVDHPAHKAEFKITVRVGRDFDVISNMPVEGVSLDGGKVVSFKKTPRMSTYLLYLGAGKFEEIRQRFGDIDVIVATMPGNARKGEFALEVASRSIQFYESFFGMSYVLPKLHLIAIPEFSAGAMENWGAITFRELAILVDENTSVRVKKIVAEVVAHEVAHQWFGNLVTMMWWDDIWLNESFATFMSYKAFDALYPQWLPWHDFLRRETSEAFDRDCLKNTHPIEAAISSPSEIEQRFDAVSYGKGASILRMIEAYLGADDFRRGVNDYLTIYKFSNATGEDLWSSLEKSSGKTIKAVMGKWTTKPGYPLVTVSMSGNRLILRQERFLLSGESERDVWPIPITMKLNDETKKLLFDREQAEIEARNLKSLKLNLDQTGFYRVDYGGLYDYVWKAELSPLERWGIVSDSLAFLMAGKMPLGEYLSLVKRCYNEGDYLPALEVSGQLALLNSIIPNRVSDVSREFHRSQLEVLKGRTDENSSMLRGIVARRLAMIDDEYARELGHSFYDYEKVQPDMRDAVATAYARAYADFEGILSKYRSSSSDEERLKLLNSMMSFNQESLVALSLGLALSGEVKRQDVWTIVLAGTNNRVATEVTWIWIKTNLQMLRKLYEGTGTLSWVFLSVIPILGVGRVEQVEKFFADNRILEADKGIEAGLEKLKIYERLAKRV